MSPWVSKPGWIPRLHALSPVCKEFLRFTSGVTPADLLAASCIPNIHVAEVGCRDSIGRPPSKHLNICSENETKPESKQQGG